MLNKRDEVKIISESYYAKMRELLVGKTTASRLVDDKGKVLLPKGEKITLEALNEESRTATGTRSSSTPATARSRSSSSSSPPSSRRSSASAKSTSARRSIASRRATSCRRA